MRAVGSLQYLQDRFGDAVGIGENVIVPESNDATAAILQPSRAVLIVLIFVVLPTVCFDAELMFEADEIQNEWAERVLAPELVAVQPSAAQN